MARMAYDDQTAAAFKAVREVPRDGLEHWREAITLTPQNADLHAGLAV